MPKHFETKVTLLDVEPDVWRSILLPDDLALTDVAAVILGAMGWKATHMFAFEVDGKRYDMKFGDGLDLEDSVEMVGVLARDVFRPGVEAAFQYDFGDDWWHDIDIIAHRETAAGDKPPRCVDGAGACPPEDSGGPFGYPAMLDAAADPEHPDHDDIKAWLETFSPGDFDVAKANRDIKKILKLYRS